MKKATLSVLTAIMMIYTLTACGSSGNYTLSFSLLDNDTGEQYTTLEDALEKGNEICNKYSKDHTQSTKFAGKQKDNGTLDNKQTVIYEFHEISEDDMESMKDEFEKIFPKSDITVSEK